MAVKFSAFTTRTGTLDASTRIVGYDDPAGTKTNVEFTLATLGANSGIYTADGTISGDRTVTMPSAGGLHFQTANITASILSIGYEGGYANINLRPASPANGSVHRIRAGSVAMISKYTAGNTQFFGNESAANNSYGFNMGAAPNGSSTDVVVIKGQTATDASSSLLIKDSGNVEILRVRDDGVAKFSGQAYTEQHDSLAGNATVDWNNGNVQYIQLASGANTFTPSNPQDGATYILQIKQPSSGAAGTITWGASVKWPAATAPILSTTNDYIDIVSLIYNGTTTHYYAAATLDLR